MIAHNVSIGKNCVIVAQTAIAGSAKIEDGVTIAGQVGVAGHLVVGSNTVVAARSGVTKSIKSGQFVSGFPARPHPEEKRIKVARTKLPDLLKKVKELEKKVERLEKGT
jgi:UDP-3-O-[3-hydroxymyristoyl] glucosamine N-acyltransferase